MLKDRTLLVWVFAIAMNVSTVIADLCFPDDVIILVLTGNRLIVLSLNRLLSLRHLIFLYTRIKGTAEKAREHERRNENHREPPPRSRLGFCWILAPRSSGSDFISLTFPSSSIRLRKPTRYLTRAVTGGQRSFIAMSEVTPTESQSEIQINVKGELCYSSLRLRSLVMSHLVRLRLSPVD